MDIKPKTQVGIPQAEMPPIRFDEGKVRRTNRWLVSAVVALTLLVVALGVGLIVQAGSEETAGLADAATVKMIDELNKAASTDGERFASFFTEDGVMDEVTFNGFKTRYFGEKTTGRAAIARHQQEYIDDYGFWVERVGPVVQSGSYVAHAANGLIVVYKLAEPTPIDPEPDRQIRHMWRIVG
jgi:hypothetical protein